MKVKVKEVLDFQEAMNNLALIAEMDMDHPPRLGVLRGRTLTTDEEEFPMGSIQWLSGEGLDPVYDVLDKTFRTIHNHLLFLYESPETDWESAKMRSGIAATMSLVGESALKMDRYLAFRIGKPLEEKISQREEYKALQQFYLHRFQKKIEGGVEGEKAWAEEWQENSQAPAASVSGLKDFETVKRDREYELFLIRNEEGNPYFTPDLLRNVKLTVDLESSAETFEEDPFLKALSIQDRDIQASANQILGECAIVIEEYLKIAKKLFDNDLSGILGKALISLFLAANPRNLLQNTSGKNCQRYFVDFLTFLRGALKTVEYQKWLAYPPDPSDKSASTLLKLAHHLCYAFFLRAGGVKQEMVGLIHRVMRKGEESFQAEKKHLLRGENLWTQILLDDERMRACLQKFPNGPLFKVLDLIRETQEEDSMIPFDPIGQGNYPFKQYSIETKAKPVHVIRCPSPIRQFLINKTEIVEEFRGFLRSIGSGKKRHLIVNLNDRTSWREYTRSAALENLQKHAEFNHQLFVMTLPKDTDFYHQNQEYLNLNRATDFLRAFYDQLSSSEECGYFFSASWKKESILEFAKNVLPAIHRCFFDEKETLTRRNREDLIEIFYQFLILKAIQEFQPDSLSFTCKDGVDVGPAQAAAFYGFIKLLNEGLNTPEDRDALLWILYSPALLIRERAVDPERLIRTVSALERCETEINSSRNRIVKEFDRMFDSNIFESFRVISGKMK